jgi:serine/threonine-protein kinase
MKQLFVEVHAYFNELEPALRLLALSVEDGLADLQWMDYCPLLASLRPDPRFAALRATVAERVAQVLRALREPI